MKIMILDANETILASSRKSGYGGVSLVYQEPYEEGGDQVVLEVDEPGIYLIQLDETLGTHPPIYLEKEASFTIPVSEVKRTCYSRYAFQGSRHLLTLSHVSVSPPAGILHAIHMIIMRRKGYSPPMQVPMLKPAGGKWFLLPGMPSMESLPMSIMGGNTHGLVGGGSTKIRRLSFIWILEDLSLLTRFESP